MNLNYLALKISWIMPIIANSCVSCCGREHSSRLFVFMPNIAAIANSSHMSHLKLR